MMPCCALSLNCADIILLHLVTSTIRQDRDIQISRMQKTRVVHELGTTMCKYLKHMPIF